MALTDSAIRNAKPSNSPYKLFDGGGLHLQITPKGSKLWRLKYRYDGREKLLSFGPYPVTGLKKARLKRDEAKAKLLDGIDPSRPKRAARREAQLERSNTFDAISQEYLAKLEKEGRAAVTLKKIRWLLDFTKNHFAGRPINEIDPPEVLALLRELEATGKYETTRRMRSLIGSVYRYAIATGRASVDPTYSLKGALIAPKVASRAAITDRDGLRRLLLAMDAFDGQPTTKTALQLLVLLASRPGELRKAEWTEFDLEGAVWRIPAERMKMRRPHRVPLPNRAVVLLKELRRISGTSSLLFPSVRSLKKPISENTLNVAIRRMGFTKEEMTSHGFRATFSTLANESGLWNADAIERALGHVESNDVRRAYLRAEFWDERVQMAEWWAGQLDEFRRNV
ncbi:MAG: integrase arm-type DNA-binding domain-containing protein [Pseudomonadota bacterium]